MKHVYAMSRPNGAIKVGISGELEIRKRNLSCQIKQPVELVFSGPKRADARMVEKIAHELLGEKRDTGEWFFVSMQEAMDAVSLAVDIVEGRVEDNTGILAKNDSKPDTTRWMKPKNLRLTEPQLENLQKIADQRGTKIPEIVRRALDEFIDRWKKSMEDR